MSYSICMVAVCPVRAEASHKSEMVSQFLFGESGTILEETKDFIKVKSLHDGYEGWCQRSQLVISDKLLIDPNGKLFIDDWVKSVTINGMPAPIPLGVPVPGGIETLQVGPYTVQYPAGNWNTAQAQLTPEQIKSKAFALLNTPYLWGGRSIFGIDCSGFTQLVFRFFNLSLLRDAYQQATQGEVIGFLQEARCGDLAFFDNEEGRITHVGILLNDQVIIHASGKVRVDKIDNAGIINIDTNQRTHKLRIIKRYW